MPFEGPQGQQFDDFGHCVETLMDSGMTEQEAKEACGKWQAQTKENVYNAQDPTQTITKRKNFRQAMGGRWQDVRGNNREWIENLHQLDGTRTRMRYREFFETMARNEVLEQTNQRIIEQGNHWTGSWVRTAYQQGLSKAESELINAGAPERAASEATRISQTLHRNALKQEYITVYTTVSDHISFAQKKVTDEFQQALQNGKSPRWLADQTNAVIRSDVKNRYTSMANTAIVRAVNEAALTSYEMLGVNNLAVAVEHIDSEPRENAKMRHNAAGEAVFTTAGDSRVCPQCQALAGETLKLSEVRDASHLQPPIHPNCRCWLMPAPMELKGEDVEIEVPEGFSGGLRADEGSALL